MALALAPISCTKLERSPSDIARGKMMSEDAPFLDAIPAEYGRLVGISTVGDGWNALWFEKKDGTIVVIGANWAERKMLNKVAMIPRK
jgi:hypothetical protein